MIQAAGIEEWRCPSGPRVAIMCVRVPYASCGNGLVLSVRPFSCSENLSSILMAYLNIPKFHEQHICCVH